MTCKFWDHCTQRRNRAVCVHGGYCRKREAIQKLEDVGKPSLVTSINELA